MATKQNKIEISKKYQQAIASYSVFQGQAKCRPIASPIQGGQAEGSLSQVGRRLIEAGNRARNAAAAERHDDRGDHEGN